MANGICKECLSFARESRFAGGVIANPGKFEGEPLRTYHAYHYAMDGFEDEASEDDTQIVRVGRSIIEFTDNGFVYGEHFATADEAEADFAKLLA